MSKHQGRGRPAKFREPSRPVTVTLPERTLDQLRRIDADRGKAIVAAVEKAVESDPEVPPISIMEIAPDSALIVVPENTALGSLPWLRLIRISTGRCLLAIDPGTAIEKVEVGLMDLIGEARDASSQDASMLEALLQEFRNLRRDNKVSKAEIMLVSTQR